jgi:CHAT domain-containing protein
MMSSLQLADGPLMLYDLEDLDPPPLQVVLAACHSAVARLHAGHELLGLAHALLWFGSSGVVATSLPAPDAETAVLMGGLHAGLARGQGVAEALWNARQHVDPSTPAGYATSAGFQAYGY